MFDSAILDVAIGLAFIILLVSLLVSAACEMLSAWLKWRSEHLWEGIEHLLQSAEARTALYNHPLIKGLTRMGPDNLDWKNGRNGPSYIPSRNFSIALVDILRHPREVAKSIQDRLTAATDQAAADPARAFEIARQLVSDMAADGVPDVLKSRFADLKATVFVDLNKVGELRSEVTAALTRLGGEDSTAATAVKEWVSRQVGAEMLSSDFRNSLVSAIDTLSGSGSPAVQQLKADLDRILGGLVHGNPEQAIHAMRALLNEASQKWLHTLNQTVTPLLEDAANDIDRQRENLEIWFNASMDRVSGWYKRHIMLWQAGIALVIAGVLNVDALQITRTLWKEPTLRQSLVSSATTYAQTAQAPIEQPEAESSKSAGGKTLTTRLNQVRLSGGSLAIATISIPIDAVNDTSVVVERQTENILLGTSDKDLSKEPVRLTVPKGESATQVFVKGSGVSTPTSAQFKVSTGELTTETKLVVAPRPEEAFAELQEQVAQLGLPIGWTCPSTAPGGQVDAAATVGGPVWCSLRAEESTGWIAWGLLTMMVGWLITAAAASLGAPFWFDMLKKVASVRSSGKAPEEKPISPKVVSQPTEPGQLPKETVPTQPRG